MSKPQLNHAQNPDGRISASRRETPAESSHRQRRMALAAVVGTAVEWYDFYLYAAMASIVFAVVFFPGADPQLATLQAFATFAVGFLARPIGGIVFGAMGDRIGRQKPWC
jgi:MFS family permease